MSRRAAHRTLARPLGASSDPEKELPLRKGVLLHIERHLRDNGDALFIQYSESQAKEGATLISRYEGILEKLGKHDLLDLLQYLFG